MIFFLELSELLQSLHSIPPRIDTTSSICSSTVIQPANALPTRQVSAPGLVSFGVHVFRWWHLTCLLCLCWPCFSLANKILITSSNGSSFGFYIQDVICFDFFFFYVMRDGDVVSIFCRYLPSFPSTTSQMLSFPQCVFWAPLWKTSQLEIEEVLLGSGVHSSGLWGCFSAHGTLLTLPWCGSHFPVSTAMPCLLCCLKIALAI